MKSGMDWLTLLDSLLAIANPLSRLNASIAPGYSMVIEDGSIRWNVQSGGEQTRKGEQRLVNHDYHVVERSTSVNRFQGPFA